MKRQFVLIAAFLLQFTYCSLKAFSQDSTASSQTNVINPGPGVTDTSKYAILYVYRLKSFAGAAVGYNLHMDDSVVCRVKNNTKYAIRIYKEGPVKLWAETEHKEKLNINVHFGEVYFLKCGIKMGIMMGRPELTMIAADQGRLDFENLSAKNTKGEN